MSTGANIKRLREQHGLTQEQLGKMVDVSRSTITQWERGWTTPRMGNVQLLAGALGVSTADIIADELPPSNAIKPTTAKPAYAPLLGRVHAGKAQEPDVLQSAVPVPYEIIKRHPQGYFLQVEGDCMDNVYPEGCYILIDPEQRPSNGSIAVVSIDGADYVMRRLYRGANTLILSPDSHNTEHVDMVFAATTEHTVEFHGTVVWFQASKEME
ncbi:Antitoxin PezA [Collinsella aerofaciens]|uniref:Antitoxin PezA n=1 Tax=Collinsella aerofaciens TaxID=74426 RepID=A0A5K1JFK9_9ACTN|nr:S24 family peptidase [Collinsella aerofaciens]VWM03418.1 Antitoxin PezA [Collinsella aerofaciens]